MTVLTAAETFRAIPGKEVEAVVRGRIIRVGSMTCLRKVDAGGAPGKAAKCHHCKSNLKEKRVCGVRCCDLHFLDGGNN